MLLQTGPASLNDNNSLPTSTFSQNNDTSNGIDSNNSSLHLYHTPISSSITSSSSASSSITPPTREASSYLENIQEHLKEGYTVHAAKDGRLYYCK